jgi:hypothetical protein
LEIGEATDEAGSINEEITVIGVEIRDLCLIGSCPTGVTIIPRACINILSPRVSNSDKIVLDYPSAAL